ncbi:MAG: FHA domain-containing protein [Dactylosporangium sp.]|nr:FHA domain-containing protein [Dactylosporangium sp.]NNJ61240.1 FHA domain-containing protein [Dactylosporangium sp.]
MSAGAVLSTSGSWYVAGELTGLVGPSTVLLMAAAPDDPLVSTLWPMIASGAEPAALIGTLAFGGVADLPDFALACRAPNRTVLLARGVVAAIVTHLDGRRSEVAAVGVLTWAERVVQDAAQVKLAGVGPVTGPSLPLLGGVVRASSLGSGTAEGRDTLADPEAAGPQPALSSAEPVTAADQRPERPVEPAPAAGAVAAAPRASQAQPGRRAGASPFSSRLLREPSEISGDVRVEPAADRTAPLRSAPVGTHDGRTVARTEAVASGVERRPVDRRGRPVHAISCSTGHRNPPTAVTCRQCAGRLDPDQIPVALDGLTLGILRFSTGQRVAIDRPLIVVGRELCVAGSQARLVTIPGVAALSRTHVEFRVEGWTVEVVDCSTNGTWVTPSRPGQKPVKLAPRQPVAIDPGATVILADEVSIRYDAGDDGA